jgi:hypothetical protein
MAPTPGRSSPAHLPRLPHSPMLPPPQQPAVRPIIYGLLIASLLSRNNGHRDHSQPATALQSSHPPASTVFPSQAHSAFVHAASRQPAAFFCVPIIANQFSLFFLVHSRLLPGRLSIFRPPSDAFFSARHGSKSGPTGHSLGPTRTAPCSRGTGAGGSRADVREISGAASTAGRSDCQPHMAGQNIGGGVRLGRGLLHIQTARDNDSE